MAKTDGREVVYRLADTTQRIGMFVGDFTIETVMNDQRFCP